MAETALFDAVLNVAKRRGFVFNSAELYNGAGGLYDLGPLGVALSTNIKSRWWKRFVQERDDILPIETAILTPQSVLVASGHVANFSDPLIECEKCHIRLRADHFLEEESEEVWCIRWRDEAVKYRKIGEKRAEAEAADAAKVFHETKLEGTSLQHALVCPNCLERRFTEPRQFNMMFKTYLGPVEDAGSVAYLRPETAQGIFTNYKNVLDTYHRKLPFGIAQIGKAFRNEITTGNSLFRVREFEQAEIEYFLKPGTDEVAFSQWVDQFERFLHEDLGLASDKLRRFEHSAEKLSHYSKRTVDFEYDFPFGGWSELMGVANRTDYDLQQHAEHSKKDLSYFDEESRERFLPYVIEPSLGLGRAMLAVLVNAYREYPQGRDGSSGELETVFHFPYHLAPIKVAVLPLMKKDGLGDKAREIAAELRKNAVVAYDESGAIGRRYRRQDEIGTPYCVTIDYETLENGTVTLRDRDTMQQQRISIGEISARIGD